MLTTRLQIQALANRLAGLPTQFKPRHFSEPWKTCWLALDGALPGQLHTALADSLRQIQEPYNPDVILNAILLARPGALLGDPHSLLDLSADLSPIRWIWPGWMPRGMITLLGAVPGAGKSYLSLDLARRIIHGEPFPDGQPCPRPGANVLYVDAEAVPQILNERAQSWGMDRSRLFLMLPDTLGILDFGEARDQERLVELVADLQPELIVIDSLSSISSKGENNVEDIRLVLAFLNRLIQEFEAGLILIHHLRKSANLHPKLWDIGIDDFRGSSHILAISRSVLGLSVVQTGPDPDRNGPRKLQLIKTNLCAFPEPLGFSFAPLQPAGVCLKWGAAPQAYKEPSGSEKCKEWLESILREGERRPGELVELGKAEGFSRTTIYRSRDELGGAIENTLPKQHPKNTWRWAA